MNKFSALIGRGQKAGALSPPCKDTTRSEQSRRGPFPEPSQAAKLTSGLQPPGCGKYMFKPPRLRYCYSSPADLRGREKDCSGTFL